MSFSQSFQVETSGRGTMDLTSEMQSAVSASGVVNGLANIFVHHTSASLILCENADPSVRTDLETWFAGAVKDGDSRFVHRFEGPDDMSAHIRATLTQPSISVPVEGGRLALGTWQGIYLWEHRTNPHRRRLTVTVIGE
mgnify:CR=1 FL=1